MHGTPRMKSKLECMHKIPCWKTLPVNYPSQSHWPQHSHPLADRWPGKWISEKARNAWCSISLFKKWQPSRPLYEKRVKLMPKRKEQESRQAERNHFQFLRLQDSIDLCDLRHKQQVPTHTTNQHIALFERFTLFWFIPIGRLWYL